MSHWPAPHCDDCWDKLNPERLSPREGSGPPEACVHCGRLTISGIYVKSDLPPKRPCDAWREFWNTLSLREQENTDQTVTLTRTELAMIGYAVGGFTLMLMKMEEHP